MSTKTILIAAAVWFFFIREKPPTQPQQQQQPGPAYSPNTGAPRREVDPNVKAGLDFSKSLLDAAKAIAGEFGRSSNSEDPDDDGSTVATA